MQTKLPLFLQLNNQSSLIVPQTQKLFQTDTSFWFWSTEPVKPTLVDHKNDVGELHIFPWPWYLGFQANLLQLPPFVKALHALLHQEQTDPMCCRLRLSVGHGHYHHQICHPTIWNKYLKRSDGVISVLDFKCNWVDNFEVLTQYLVAVEDPVTAVLLGIRPHTLKVTGKKIEELSHWSDLIWCVLISWCYICDWVLTCLLLVQSWRWQRYISQRSSLGWSVWSVPCCRSWRCRAWRCQSAAQNLGLCSCNTFCSGADSRDEMKDEEIADYLANTLIIITKATFLWLFFLNGIEQQFSQLSEMVKSYLDKKKKKLQHCSNGSITCPHLEKA